MRKEEVMAITGHEIEKRAQKPPKTEEKSGKKGTKKK